MVFNVYYVSFECDFLVAWAVIAPPAYIFPNFAALPYSTGQVVVGGDSLIYFGGRLQERCYNSGTGIIPAEDSHTRIYPAWFIGGAVPVRYYRTVFIYD